MSLQMKYSLLKQLLNNQLVGLDSLKTMFDLGSYQLSVNPIQARHTERNRVNHGYCRRRIIP